MVFTVEDNVAVKEVLNFTLPTFWLYKSPDLNHVNYYVGSAKQQKAYQQWTLNYKRRQTVRLHLHRTSGHSNLTKRPHRCRTWTLQSYSPGCANVHPM